jgi:hypothetical protein
MTRLPAVTLLFCLACGGISNQVTGTVKGNSLTVRDAILLGNTEVWLSSTEKLCDALRMNAYPKSARLMKLQLYPVATGDFSVVVSTTGKDHSAAMQFDVLNDACMMQLVGQESAATSGKVTVVTFDTMRSITGTFDVTFGDTDRVTGSFNASWCDAPTTYPSPDCK